MGSPYTFYGLGRNLPNRKSGMVSRDELARAIKTNPFTSIDNMISYNRWMKDTIYLGDSLTRVS